MQAKPDSGIVTTFIRSATPLPNDRYLLEGHTRTVEMAIERAERKVSKGGAAKASLVAGLTGFPQERVEYRSVPANGFSVVLTKDTFSSDVKGADEKQQAQQVFAYSLKVLDSKDVALCSLSRSETALDAFTRVSERLAKKQS